MLIALQNRDPPFAPSLFSSRSFPERNGWIVLGCAHATGTVNFDQNLINLACALPEHEG